MGGHGVLWGLKGEGLGKPMGERKGEGLGGTWGCVSGEGMGD